MELNRMLYRLSVELEKRVVDITSFGGRLAIAGT
jgi:hypothetical protein